MGATAILAEFASRTVLADIDAPAIAATKRHILDCVGVALAAAGERPGRIIVDVVRQQGGAPQAAVLGSNVRTDAVSAAWANGVLAHLLDFDDSGFSHPSACIVPAALAMGEQVRATGAQIVCGVCVGLEVFERLSSSSRAHQAELRRRGFHPTSLYGAAAAAAAAGNICGLEPRQLAVAIGLAAANAGGLTQHFGTWGKGVHAGNAARSGVVSALLAQKGYDGDQEVLEGDYGFFSAFHGTGNYDLGKVGTGLGDSWAVVSPGLTIKRYPCCGANLRALDAARSLIEEYGITFEAVSRLEVDVNPGLLNTVRFHKPDRGFQGKFSIDYVLAAMLLDGRVDLDSFTDEYCNAPRMRAALQKVRVNVRHDWRGDPHSRLRTPVSITLRDGPVYTRAVEAVRGSPANPLSRDELVEKFRVCAGRALDAGQVDQSIMALECLEAMPAVDALVETLVL